MNELEKINETIFESIKHVDDEGNEYWYARELQQILGYKDWRYFSAVIEKAQIACSQSNNINYNFGVDTQIVKTGISSKFILDYKLSRYVCYLIVQNANPKYETVALGAINTCQASNYVVSNHFVDADKMVDIGSNTLKI